MFGTSTPTDAVYSGVRIDIEFVCDKQMGGLNTSAHSYCGPPFQLLDVEHRRSRYGTSFLAYLYRIYVAHALRRRAAPKLDDPV